MERLQKLGCRRKSKRRLSDVGRSSVGGNTEDNRANILYLNSWDINEFSWHICLVMNKVVLYNSWKKYLPSFLVWDVKKKNYLPPECQYFFEVLYCTMAIRGNALLILGDQNNEGGTQIARCVGLTVTVKKSDRRGKGRQCCDKEIWDQK